MRRSDDRASQVSFWEAQRMRYWLHCHSNSEADLLRCGSGDPSLVACLLHVALHDVIVKD